MSRRSAVVALALVAVVAVAGCKEQSDAASDLPRPSKAFCKAAADYDKKIERGARIGEHIELVSAIAAEAPKDVADDAETFLDALKRRQDGDESVVDNDRVKTAVDNLNRRAGQDCGWYKREGM
jgi:hypothetical protein